jgi:hypothetical protein
LEICMDLLNSLIGKEGGNRLKNQLLEKSDEILLMESLRSEFEHVTQVARHFLDSINH